MARIECRHDGCTYVVPEGHGDATTAALITAHSRGPHNEVTPTGMSLHERITPTRTTSAHTVEARGTVEMPQPESGGPDALRSERNANTVARGTTWQRCAGVNRRKTTHSTRMHCLMRHARSPPSMPKTPRPRATTSTTSPPSRGFVDNQSLSRSYSFRWRSIRPTMPH